MRQTEKALKRGLDGYSISGYFDTGIDVGFVLLLRFGSPDSCAQLPVWVRPHVKHFPQFGAALKGMMAFFKNAEKTVSIYQYIYTVMSL